MKIETPLLRIWQKEIADTSSFEFLIGLAKTIHCIRQLKDKVAAVEPAGKRKEVTGTIDDKAKEEKAIILCRPRTPPKERVRNQR